MVQLEPRRVGQRVQAGVGHAARQQLPADGGGGVESRGRRGPGGVGQGFRPEAGASPPLPLQEAVVRERGQGCVLEALVAPGDDLWHRPGR